MVLKNKQVALEYEHTTSETYCCPCCGELSDFVLGTAEQGVEEELIGVPVRCNVCHYDEGGELPSFEACDAGNEYDLGDVEIYEFPRRYHAWKVANARRGTLTEGDPEIGDGPREPFEAEAPDGPEALQNTIHQRRQLMARCWEMVEELRREELDSVEIPHRNVEFGMWLDSVVVCKGYWTTCEADEFGEKGRQFFGNSTLEALEKAVAARRKAEGRGEGPAAAKP